MHVVGPWLMAGWHMNILLIIGDICVPGHTFFWIQLFSLSSRAQCSKTAFKVFSWLVKKYKYELAYPILTIACRYAGVVNVCVSSALSPVDTISVCYLHQVRCCLSAAAAHFLVSPCCDRSTAAVEEQVPDGSSHPPPVRQKLPPRQHHVQPSPAQAQLRRRQVHRRAQRRRVLARGAVICGFSFL